MWSYPVNEWLSLFLACQHLSSGKNLRECENQSWFKVQVVPVFRFDWYTKFSRFLVPLRCLRILPGVSVPQVEYHWSRQDTQPINSLLLRSRTSQLFLVLASTVFLDFGPWQDKWPNLWSFQDRFSEQRCGHLGFSEYAPLLLYYNLERVYSQSHSVQVRAFVVCGHHTRCVTLLDWITFT
jgi:hypothetical protein